MLRRHYYGQQDYRKNLRQKEWVDSAGISYDETAEADGNIGEFNINDESTYGVLKVGTLTYELFKKIFETGSITDEEIEKLKEKEYSKQLFSKTDYPVLADNREDNRGKSNVIRYKTIIMICSLVRLWMPL